MQKILSIQYLRAFAASLVVLHHLSWNTGRWLDAGEGGVDLFFVISGFIMWTISREAETSPPVFMWRRLVRIVPLYWAATLACFLIAVAIPNFFWTSDNFGWSRLLHSLAFIPQFDPVGGAGVAPVIPMGWTLNVEMFFYVCVAATLYLPRQVQFWALSGSLTALVAVGSLVQTGNALEETYTQLRVLEFVLGLALGWLAQSGRLGGQLGGQLGRQLGGARLGWVLLAAGVIGFFGLQPLLRALFGEAGNPFGLAERQMFLFVFGVPSALIVAGALAIERSVGVPRWPWLLLVGDASYALYLTHDIILHITLRAQAPWFVEIPISYGLSVVFAILVFKFYEKPISDMFRRRRKMAASPA